ncbi:Xaa-His dipeptidase [Liquorilactobacillus aquaticus DSM 21051]|uniref:Xaa-His dipeptidase n=1 Tax=Liquorilactobacillus aquaticus DSM 21051 TaxID=1423725 RepID=A0A0R2CVK9_9LACO|nr:dipeptidase PepV [Liquorilactobacillus aquaticus]KRM95250.1 Xaa-His dipeptidase [Liquorilactobacillus aquaticus DSM 21051]
MQIDWIDEIDKRKNELLLDLQELLKIKSVCDEEHASKEAPFGPGPKKALEKFLQIGDRDGFKTLNLDGIAGHIEYGTGNEVIGILAHVDVMPAGEGWDTDPFIPVVKDGRLYGRGASDDKGPAMATYYALKLIKELNLPVSKKVRFILGTDEESGWRCVKHYFERMPLPDYGFSPDAFFPLINGEKGNVTYSVNFLGSNEGEVTLVDFKAGMRENMVPREAIAHLSGINSDSIEEKFNAFISQNPIQGKFEKSNGIIELEVIGKAAHAQEPRNGINAGTYLALFLNELKLGGEAKNYIEFAAKWLHEDSRMNNFGIHFTDNVMGDLTMNAGIFNFKNSSGGSVILNFRFPRGIKALKIKKALEKETAPLKAAIKLAGKLQEPHYVPLDDPMVKTLLGVYERQTGNKGYGVVVGGGTYGRLMERGVAFGAMFPNVPDTMHQVNEFIPVEDLLKAAAIYAESIYELIK